MALVASCSSAGVMFGKAVVFPQIGGLWVGLWWLPKGLQMWRSVEVEESNVPVLHLQKVKPGAFVLHLAAPERPSWSSAAGGRV